MRITSLKPAPLVVAIVVAVCTAGTTSSWAYSRANHMHLTVAAVRLVNACVSHGVGRMIGPGEERALVHYNDVQDKWTKKAVLWHFPNRAGSEPQKSGGLLIFRPFVVSTVIDPWVRYLETELGDTAPAADVYPALGAALHYVQDLAVPSHAVPIFHPSSYWLKADRFDASTLYDVVLPEGGELAAFCNELPGAETLAEVIGNVRETTLRRITGDWARLWPKEDVDRKTGFARYGCKGNDLFNGTDIDCDDAPITLTWSDYYEFASAQANLAVRASARAIVLFQSRLDSSCVPGECVPPLDNARWIPSRKTLKSPVEDH